MKPTKLLTVDSIKSHPSSLEDALKLLAIHGYDNVLIPEPIKDNIQPDRIYFLVRLKTRFSPRTAFIKAALESNSVLLDVVRGWPIEHPHHKERITA